MATLGSLSLSLSADTKALRKGLQKGRGLIKGFAADIGKMAKGFAIFGAAATAAAVGGLAALAKRQASYIDETAKFADRIGMSTEGLVGLQKAARETGVPIAALQMGLQRMTRRVAEAAKGTGEAKNALAELGIDAQHLATLAPEDQFREIAEAMQNVGNRSDQVRLAMKLFDSEGVALVNTLDLGAKGLDEVAERAEKLGLTFSRLDAKKVEIANDKFAELGDLVDAVGNTLAVEVAPYIGAAAKAFVEWANEGEGLSKKVVDGLERVGYVAAFLVDTFSVLKGVAQGVGSAVAKAVAIMARGIGKIAVGVEGLASYIGQDLDLSSGLLQAAEIMDDSAGELFERAGESLSAGLEGKAQKDFRAFVQKIKSEAEAEASAALEETKPAGDALEVASEAAATSVEGLVEAAENIGETAGQLQSVTPKLDAMTEAISRVPEQMSRVAIALLSLETGTIAAVDELARYSTRAVEAIRRTLDTVDRRVARVEKELRAAAGG